MKQDSMEPADWEFHREDLFFLRAAQTFFNVRLRFVKSDLAALETGAGS
jgi:hypothetical protein